VLRSVLAPTVVVCYISLFQAQAVAVRFFAQFHVQIFPLNFMSFRSTFAVATLSFAIIVVYILIAIIAHVAFAQNSMGRGIMTAVATLITLVWASIFLCQLITITVGALAPDLPSAVNTHDENVKVVLQ